ncbi:MAG: hypothetical protein NVSMB65_16200 [Chloroflexota bacterium]
MRTTVPGTVVGMRAGGVQDLVRDAQTGILCRPDDGESFVAAAARLAGNAALRTALGREARRDAEGHTWEAVFDSMMGRYAGLISARALPEARAARA